jgi:DNA invertase Pin-like site-specific DNA recombinase
VQDLSRFARNHKDQAEAIYDLGQSGVSLRSTYESNIDETAAGKLAANFFGAFNQFFRIRTPRNSGTGSAKLLPQDVYRGMHPSATRT